MTFIKTKTNMVKNLQTSSQMSRMSKFINFLIKIKFVPIKIDAEISNSSFKLLSVGTFFYIMLYYGALFLNLVIRSLVFKETWAMVMAQMLEKNSIDMISLWVYMLFVYVVLPFCPFLLANALP